MARSTNEQNKTQNCNTRKASQKATQSTTQKTTNSTTDCGCGCGTKGKDDGSKMHRVSGRGRTVFTPTERYLAV